MMHTFDVTNEDLATYWSRHQLSGYGITLSAFLLCPDEITAWLEADEFRPLLLKQRLVAQRWDDECRTDRTDLVDQRRVVCRAGDRGLIERRVQSRFDPHALARGGRS